MGERLATQRYRVGTLSAYGIGRELSAKILETCEAALKSAASAEIDT
jgi:hypothetical protein